MFLAEIITLLICAFCFRCQPMMPILSTLLPLMLLSGVSSFFFTRILVHALLGCISWWNKHQFRSGVSHKYLDGINVIQFAQRESRNQKSYLVFSVYNWSPQRMYTTRIPKRHHDVHPQTRSLFYCTESLFN